MTRPKRRPRRRSTLPRIALYAWLAVVVVASTLPFLVEIRLWEPGGWGYWGCKHGSVYRASVDRSSVNAVRGHNLTHVEWNPGTAACIGFVCGPSSGVEPRSYSRSTPFVVRAPPWAVLLVPTLLVLVLGRAAARFVRARLWLGAQRRKLLAAGRLPCANCDYDVTGLERCPECGTPARAAWKGPIRPARLALLAWLGFAGLASLMPFLVHTHYEIGDVSLGMGAGGAYGFLDMQNRGPASSGFLFSHWRPSLLHMLTFDGGWNANYRAAQAPPWIVLLVPTLLALAAHGFIRHRAARTLKNLGRTPCPACGYDATGLEVCPECGAALGAEA